MRKECLESLIHTGEIEAKRERGKYRITYMMDLSKLMAKQSLGEITKIKLHYELQRT